MERLTERTGEGQAIPRMDLKNNGHQRCMERLAEYEDFEEIFRSKMTDASCDFLKDKEEFAKWLDRNKWIAKKCDEYARAEEQGKLLKLPCAVGDEFYCIWRNKGQNPIQKMQVKKIEIHERKGIVIQMEFVGNRGCLFRFYEDDFGKTVFLTREEAEAALKEMSE